MHGTIIILIIAAIIWERPRTFKSKCMYMSGNLLPKHLELLKLAIIYRKIIAGNFRKVNFVVSSVFVDMNFVHVVTTFCLNCR